MMKPTQRLESIDLSGVRKMFDLVGEGTINLALGEPDFNTPSHIKDAVKRALDENFTHYTGNQGTLELREAISEKLRQDNHIETSPENVIVTVGASEALLMSTLALVDKGDEVLIPDPGFVSYQACVELAGGTTVPVELDCEDDFRLNPENVQEKISQKSKAIIMNSPANPTGGVMKKEDVKGLAEIAQDHDLVIISDEIYEKIIYGSKHYSPGRYTKNAITINGFSKAYAMTGFRVGYLSAPSNLSEALLKVHQYSTACASSLSQAAALEALTGPQDSVGEMVAEFQRRRDLVVSRLNGMGIECKLPQGAFYLFPQVRDPELFVSEAIKEGVVLVPGASFGAHGAGHFRLSYATSYPELLTAMDRLELLEW
ncbi:MAG: pyridoxal phosphate-dependent aminotransferase [Euryarchaeota archaeon]|nr:pyridoxal phosphate-dependent aminotransferase [Euryarchaeota archaeon]